MSWYSTDYEARAAIAVPDTTGVATADIDITIPPDWDEFWSAIDVNGYGLRVTTYDGRTLVAAYAVDDGAGGAFSRTTRAGRIRLDGATMINVANTTALFWVYYDIASPTNGAAAVVMAAMINGYIVQARPTRVVRAQRQPPGLSRPTQIDHKSSAADQHYWFDVSGFLQRYPRPYNRRMVREELRAILYSVLDDAGAPVGAMVSHSSTRFCEIRDGMSRRMLVRVSVSGGTTAERYTVSLLLRTGDTTGALQTITTTLGIAVRDIVEAE